MDGIGIANTAYGFELKVSLSGCGILGVLDGVGIENMA
jgi:hypothetical protein